MTRTRTFLILLLGGLAVACQPAGEPADLAASGAAPTAQWQCRNDLEIHCDAARCEAAEGFTPMDVQFDDGGAMSVCAYSGCWQGTATVAKGGRFVVLTGYNLPFSTAPDEADSEADILIALDKEDAVAILKAGSFAHPLRCEQSEDIR